MDDPGEIITISKPWAFETARRRQQKPLYLAGEGVVYVSAVSLFPNFFLNFCSYPFAKAEPILFQAIEDWVNSRQ